MNRTAKRILALLIILLVIFGWYFTIRGIPGVMDPIKDKVQLVSISKAVFTRYSKQTRANFRETNCKKRWNRPRKSSMNVSIRWD